jgi:hypothetical protein
MLLQTTHVGDDFGQSINQRTGVFFQMHNNFLQCELFRGQRQRLMTCYSSLVTDDLRLNIHSVIMTYSQATHTMKLYFNGILKDTQVADILEPIAWSTSNNIYINRFYTNTPTDANHYHLSCNRN